MKTVEIGRNPLSYSMSNPHFPGGSIALRKYISTVVNADEPLWDKQYQLSIKICIDVSGKVFFANVGGQLDGKCRSALIEGFYQMPAWIPAYRGRTPVSSELNFSVAVH